MQDKTRQDKTTLFYQGSPISCKAGILRGPGFNKTYIYTFTIKLQGEVKFAKITGGKERKKNQIKCPLRRRLKIARELASLILLYLYAINNSVKRFESGKEMTVGLRCASAL